MKRQVIWLAVALAACGGPKYALVPPAPTTVAKGALHVRPSVGWNRSPRSKQDVAWEESWTQNGPGLDAITFIAALPAGEAIVKQRKKEARKVPVFRADMTPQDLVSMIESYYRIRAGASVFTTRAVAPATFLARPAVRFDFAYVGADDVRRLGSVVMAVVDGRLYAVLLDGAELHYFGAALPQFEGLVRTASL